MEFAPSSPTTWRANSDTATCMPRQMPTNDVTTAVAEFVANAVFHQTKATGSNLLESNWLRGEFVMFLMNPKASALGLSDTFFLNPTGLDEAHHYTSASDLTRLWNSIADDPRTATFLGMRSRTFNVTDPDGAGPWNALGCDTTNAPLIQCTSSKGYGYYPGVDADKNGGTQNCGSCLVAGATRLGRPLAAAVMQAPSMAQAAADVAELFRDAYDQMFTPVRTAQAPGPKADRHALALVSVDGLKVGEVAVTASLSAGKLRLTTWSFCVACGTLAQLAETAVDAPGAVAVEAAAVRFGMLATLVRFSSGAVELRTWNIGAKVTPAASRMAGSGTTQAITSLRRGNVANKADEYAAIGIRQLSGLYRLTVVRIAPDGGIAAAASWQSPSAIANELSLASDSGAALQWEDKVSLVAAVGTSNGAHRVSAFVVDALTGALTWRNDVDTGGGTSIVGAHLAVGSFATSMVNTRGNVIVSFWRVDPEGWIAFQADTGDRKDPGASVAVASIGPAPAEGALTYAREPGGTLELAVWENDERGEYIGKTLLRLADNPTDAGAGAEPRVIRVPTPNSAGDFVTSQIDRRHAPARDLARRRPVAAGTNGARRFGRVPFGLGARTFSTNG